MGRLVAAIIAMILVQTLCSNINMNVADNGNDIQVNFAIYPFSNNNKAYHSVILYAENTESESFETGIGPTDKTAALYLNFMGSNGDSDLTDNTDFDF